MATNENVSDPTKFLTRLASEEELIIKPFQSGKRRIDLSSRVDSCLLGNEIGATECGKIVSRLNKTLFDYQIGKKFHNLLSIRSFIDLSR